MVTLAFLNVRDGVAVFIVACRNRSESTLVVISNAYAKLPNFYIMPRVSRHPTLKHFFKSDNLATLII